MEDPLLSTMHHETDLQVAQRAYDFMLWIRNRTEKELLGTWKPDERKSTRLGMTQKKNGWKLLKSP